MKLRKGDKALIKRTCEVVTILDIELIRKNGKVHKYCKLQPKDGKPALWMDGSELGNVVEKVTATLTSDLCGHTILIEMLCDHDRGMATVKCESVCPDNLLKQFGRHTNLAAYILENLGDPVTQVVFKE